MKKLLATVDLGRVFRRFEPLFKERKHRPYITVDSQEAVELLTNTGYEGIVIQLPDDREKYTKVILFRYPLIADPDFLLDDARFVWAIRHVFRGGYRSQVIALVKGEVPEKVSLVPGTEECHRMYLSLRYTSATADGDTGRGRAKRTQGAGIVQGILSLFFFFPFLQSYRLNSCTMCVTLSIVY